MRVLAGLLVLGLLASAYLAPRHFDGRRGDLPDSHFFESDPAERAARGEKNRQLGAALSGYGEQFAEDPGDLEIMRKGIRIGLLLGGAGLGQPGLGNLVGTQITTYFENRERVDPDGTFIRKVVIEWVDLRLAFSLDYLGGFYARTAVAIYLAARGDPRGHEALRDVVERGKFYTQFFPFVRDQHPHWRAVGPLVRHYLEEGNLGGRVEAGATLIEYHTLFGDGQDLMERFLPEIREAFHEMINKLRAGRVDRDSQDRGRTAIHGLGMLGNLGYAEDRELLKNMFDKVGLYHLHADAIRIALIWAGAWKFDRYRLGTEKFYNLELVEQHAFYRAAGHRVARLRKELPAGTENAELKKAMRILEAGFDQPGIPVRVWCLTTLAKVGGKKGQAAVQRAVRERNLVSLFGAVLADDLEDPIAAFVPGLMSQEPDFSALAAVSLLEGLGDKRALAGVGDEDE